MYGWSQSADQAGKTSFREKPRSRISSDTCFARSVLLFVSLGQCMETFSDIFTLNIVTTFVSEQIWKILSASDTVHGDVSLNLEACGN